MAHGEVPGVTAGDAFPSRQALYDANVHRMTQAGIAGYGNSGPAESIVLSGGYPDDEDHGDEIIYTGEGGRDPATGRQVQDQTLTKGNLGLRRAYDAGEPVRVIRRTPGGYQYDGLYTITDHWHVPSGDGPLIHRFKLVRARVDVVPLTPLPTPGRPMPAGNAAPRTVSQTVTRVVRDTQVSKRVKQLHGNRCQVCGVTLAVPGGTYAEAAHIRGLGSPHYGPDTVDNVLCLCPNDHLLFDKGAIWIDEELRVQPRGSPLIGAELNRLNPDHLRHHRQTRAQP